eukprot:CAMPEP_0116876848 /NCGR_PEP_ID=MMETSP0463-20121206/8715_1 /TAXON_ID=181622 /ORGANISM="Strombidinopsis sp, Strain SopsisLIS2011" /LENGTH=114 /DNA_ID=CAMNT_0004523713 /DNA_START=27 /DNA_END=371 /DNA_ORIENTATION=+
MEKEIYEQMEAGEIQPDDDFYIRKSIEKQIEHEQPTILGIEYYMFMKTFAIFLGIVFLYVIIFEEESPMRNAILIQTVVTMALIFGVSKYRESFEEKRRERKIQAAIKNTKKYK